MRGVDGRSVAPPPARRRGRHVPVGSVLALVVLLSVAACVPHAALRGGAAPPLAAPGVGQPGERTDRPGPPHDAGAHPATPATPAVPARPGDGRIPATPAVPATPHHRAPGHCDEVADDGTTGLGSTVKSFESGTFDNWVREAAGAHSLQIVTDPVRCGAHAARFELRSGDVAGPIGGHRAEVHEINGHIAPGGSERWYGFSTYVPEDWPVLAEPAVISQWHATPDLADGEVWRSPPLAVRYSGEQLSVTARHSSEPVQTANDGETLTLYEHPGTFERGVWHDWVFHVRWDHGPGGLVEAWLDGRQVIDHRGPVGYNDRVGTWFKMGIYRGRDDHPETVSLYHDEYRRHERCELVAPSLCGES